MKQGKSRFMPCMNMMRRTGVKDGTYRDCDEQKSLEEGLEDRRSWVLKAWGFEGSKL